MRALDRTFGVEIECDFPRGTAGARDFLIGMGYKLGTHGRYDRYSVTADGSNTEIRTPILKGLAGFKELKKISDAIVEHGARTTSADGLHVHFGADDYCKDPDAMERLLDSWANCRLVTCMFVHHRRWGRSGWNQAALQSWKSQKRANRIPVMGRYDLNIANIRFGDPHSHFEVRLHEGTVFYHEMEPWIRLMLRFFHTAMKEKKPFKAKDSTDLFNIVGLPAKYREPLLEVASKQTQKPRMPVY